MKQGYYGETETPREALGRAAIAGVAETGNPKHAWDFLSTNAY